MPKSPYRPNIELNTTDPEVLRWIAQHMRHNGVEVTWLVKDGISIPPDDSELTAFQMEAVADALDRVEVANADELGRSDFAFGLVGLDEMPASVQADIRSALTS